MEHFLRCLDELTLDDLTIMAQKIVSSPLTMASLGDGQFSPLHFSSSILLVRFLLKVESEHVTYIMFRPCTVDCVPSYASVSKRFRAPI